MSNYIKTTYARQPETQLYKSKSTAKGNKQRKLLMGTWMGVLADEDPFYKIHTFGMDSYVLKADCTDNQYLKAFFIDVGQGDAILIETPEKRLLIDGGPSKNLENYFTKFKFEWLIGEGKTIHIDTMIISHFDYDHYKGLIAIINHPSFTIGTIFHNGIARFHKTSKERDDAYDTELGKTNYVKGSQKRTILKTTFDNLEDCQDLIDDIPTGKKGLAATFKSFLEACLKAKSEGRLNKVERVTNRDGHLPGYSSSKDLSIDVLGPVPTSQSGRYYYDWFGDVSHTINGHSVVMKLNFKGKTMLLGGDLNTLSEEHLMKFYSTNPFEVDVAKSCHHGASDFKVEFMEKIKPFATIISSGDNETYSHPRADAIGCAGKYSKGKRPLVLSTELARSYKSAEHIHYGLINMRTDGNKIVFAQMKENKVKSDLWDSYEV